MFPQRNFQNAEMFPQRNFCNTKMFPQRNFRKWYNTYPLNPFFRKIFQNG